MWYLCPPTDPDEIFNPSVEVLKSGEFHDCGFFGELRLQNCEEESYIKVGGVWNWWECMVDHWKKMDSREVNTVFVSKKRLSKYIYIWFLCKQIYPYLRRWSNLSDRFLIEFETTRDFQFSVEGTWLLKVVSMVDRSDQWRTCGLWKTQVVEPEIEIFQHLCRRGFLVTHFVFGRIFVKEFSCADCLGRWRFQVFFGMSRVGVASPNDIWQKDMVYISLFQIIPDIPTWIFQKHSLSTQLLVYTNPVDFPFATSHDRSKSPISKVSSRMERVNSAFSRSVFKGWERVGNLVCLPLFFFVWGIETWAKLTKILEEFLGSFWLV